MKTTRTGFDAERPRVRDEYLQAKAAGKTHDEACKAIAKGLPLHMVSGWVKDLQR